MKKELMQVYLEPKQKEWLEKESEQTGVPQSHLVRQALDEYIENFECLNSSKKN